jgi:hypothetical protein
MYTKSKKNVREGISVYYCRISPDLVVTVGYGCQWETQQALGKGFDYVRLNEAPPPSPLQPIPASR